MHDTPAVNGLQLAPFPADNDFRDYAAVEEIFRLPWDWPTAPLCCFHEAGQPSEDHLHLLNAMHCPSCGKPIAWVTRRDAKIIIEFIEIVNRLAHEAQR